MSGDLPDDAADDAAASGKPRGRRPAGSDTRGEILEAARTEFSVRGYDGATLRGIARRAGVDARLLRHYFADKEALYSATISLPVMVSEIIAMLDEVPQEELGAAMVRVYFTAWAPPAAHENLLNVVGHALTSEAASSTVNEFLAQEVLPRYMRLARQDDPELRAALIASQIIGTAMNRFGFRMQPLADLDVEDLAIVLGPSIQRLLFDDL